MTTTSSAPPLRTTAVWIITAGACIVLSAIAWLTNGTGWYVWALQMAVGVAGGAIALHDVRTLTIPNRYVLALGIGATSQILVVASIDRQAAPLVVGALTAGVAFAGYAAFGLAGWVGFGDAKVAAALALAASINVGMSALLLMPVAILVGALQRLCFSGLRAQPHAGALVCAALCLLVLDSVG